MIILQALQVEGRQYFQKESLAKVLLCVLYKDSRIAFLLSNSLRLFLTFDFFLLYSDQGVLQPKKNIWWNKGKLGGRNHKPVPSCVVIEIRWEFHLPNAYYISFEKVECDL